MFLCKKLSLKIAFNLFSTLISFYFIITYLTVTATLKGILDSDLAVRSISAAPDPLIKYVNESQGWLGDN